MNFVEMSIMLIRLLTRFIKVILQQSNKYGRFLCVSHADNNTFITQMINSFFLQIFFPDKYLVLFFQKYLDEYCFPLS